MRDQRLIKVRRHPYKGRKTAPSLGFQSLLGVNHLQKQWPGTGCLRKDEVKRVYTWEKQQRRQPNVGCCNPSGSEEDMYTGTETTRNWLQIRSLNK